MEKKEGPGLNWIIGAGIVGADIGTSIFYGTGILFPIVGYLAPLFVFSCCLLMWLFKTTYEEGLALSPYNGGAYSMILRSLGRRVAVLAGALTFVSYLATAAVSSVSGAQYFFSLFYDHTPSFLIVGMSFVPMILFGVMNTKGIKEPAKLVTAIAAFHFALLIIMAIWGLGYLMFHFSEIDFSKMNFISNFAHGKNTGVIRFDNLAQTPWHIVIPVVMYGFSAAFLGITGFESAAQIVEELEQPTLVTVRKLYKAVVLLVSLTAPIISILCLMILTRDQVDNNLATLLSALASTLGGKILLTIVVIDATLTLFAATNTAFVGFIGLATTMAKQGNLPQFLLYRVAHRYPAIQGYPLIALPFMVVGMIMSLIVMGDVDDLAKVYEIAFLGVMVSFCIGVVLMRNRTMRRDTPTHFLSRKVLNVQSRVIPVIPLVSLLILSFATFNIYTHARSEVLLMLTTLLSITLLAMAYYRWGELERRLEKRHDLRLGLGQFATASALPEGLKRYILATGGTGARRLINSALKYILKTTKEPFELVIFHAEENKDPEGFFFELLQRVVSQQIAPIYKDDFILTVKILPGSLSEGLLTLKKTVDFDSVIFGTGRDPYASEQLAKKISEELEVEVTTLQM